LSSLSSDWISRSNPLSSPRGAAEGNPIFDLRLDRAPPAALQSKNNSRGEKAKADRNADQCQREIEAGFPGSRIDEVEVVQKHDMSLFFRLP
jgi:hypothetical protein